MISFNCSITYNYLALYAYVYSTRASAAQLVPSYILAPISRSVFLERSLARSLARAKTMRPRESEMPPFRQRERERERERERGRERKRGKKRSKHQIGARETENVCGARAQSFSGGQSVESAAR